MISTRPLDRSARLFSFLPSVLSGFERSALRSPRLASLGGRRVVDLSGPELIVETLKDLAGNDGEFLLHRHLSLATRGALCRPRGQNLGRLVDFKDRLKLQEAIGPQTRGLFLESAPEPHGQCLDLRELSQWAHRRGLILVVDNTFMGPQRIDPLALGADLVLYTSLATLGGSPDSGALVTQEAWQ